MDEWSNNEYGYPTGDVKHSNAIHRQIAYSEIYLKYPKRYTKPFSTYVVHHIDGDKENFSSKNLYLCTKEQHDRIHEEQKRIRRKFKKAREIYSFLNKPRKKLIRSKKEKEPLKKFKCLDCDRLINHKGCCFPCNVERKKFREAKFKEEDERKEERNRKDIGKIIILSIIAIILFFIFVFSILI